MAIKKRGSNVSDEAGKLADELAERTYGKEKSLIPEDNVVRTTISLPQSLLHKTEDIASANKRAGLEPKSVSAIVRNA